MVLPGPINAIKMLRKPLSVFKRNWFAIEAIPLYIVTLGMPSIGLWYFLRVAARGPDIVWSRENSSPWNTISQNETPKLWMPLGPRRNSAGTFQHQYNERWTRPKSIRKERAGETVSYKSFIDRPLEEENRGGRSY